MVPRLKRGFISAVSAKKIPGEVRIVGVLVLLLAALYVFQLISQPSFLKSQVNGVTGLVVADTSKETEPSASQSPKQPATTATAPAETAETVKKTSVQQPAPVTDPIKIVSPPKGSTLSPGFDVNVEVSDQVLTCYYLVKDSGAVSWDRRTKPCKTTVTVTADFCKTVGKDTCYVYAEAADGNNNIIGSDNAYYSIK